MAEEFISQFAYRECRDRLEAIGRIDTPLAADIMLRLSAIGLEDAQLYLRIIEKLLSAMPGRPRTPRIGTLSDSAKIRIMRRALRDERFCGMKSAFIRNYYRELRETACMLDELGSDEESEALAHLAQRLLELVVERYLDGAGVTLVSSARQTTRPCIRPPASARPALRLVKGKS